MLNSKEAIQKMFTTTFPPFTGKLKLCSNKFTFFKRNKTSRWKNFGELYENSFLSILSEAEKQATYWNSVYTHVKFVKKSHEFQFGKRISLDFILNWKYFPFSLRKLSQSVCTKLAFNEKFLGNVKKFYMTWKWEEGGREEGGGVRVESTLRSALMFKVFIRNLQTCDS